MSHLDEGTLHALLDGEIPSAELPPIQAHLSGCPECRARLEAERELLNESEGLVGLIEVPVGAGSNPPRSRSGVSRSGWFRGLGWAASVIGAAGLGYLVHDGRSPRSDGEVVAATPPPPNPPTPETVAARGEFRTDSGLDRAGPEAPRQEQAAPERRSAPPKQRTPDDQLAETRVRDTAKEVVSDSGRPNDAAAKAVADRREAVTANQTGLGAVGRLDQPRSREAPGRVPAAPEPAGARLALAAGPEPMTFPEAVRRLDGSLRLIPGMVPIRLEAQGAAVRVVYATSQGELVLSQQLRNGQIVFTLQAPPGFPADSLELLRARVRE